MKRFVLVFGMMLAVVTLATAAFEDGWVTSSPVKARILDERIDKMLGRISRQEYDSDQAFLHSIFRKTQKEFLHRYKQYAGIDELVDGEFDCLTATSLFAEVLTRSGFNFRVVETNYHIFLFVNTSKGEVLLETTDRFRGFVTSASDIQDRIEAYKSQSAQPTSETSQAYAYVFELYNEIGREELSGLLYFNQAVKAYNEGLWEICSEKLTVAARHYNSPRISALASILLCTISVKEIPEPVKNNILHNLRSIDGQPMASR